MSSLPAQVPPGTPDKEMIEISIGMSLPNELITNPETLKNLTEAKVQAIRAFPFMAYLIMSMNYRRTDLIPTACATVIGKQDYVIFNDTCFNKVFTGLEERIFCLMHELMHIFLHHIGRQTECAYNPELWNIATDYMINAFLYHIGQENKTNGRPAITLPTWVLFEDKFYKKSADEIYHMLLKESGGDAKKAVEKHGGGGDLDKVMQGGGGKNGQPKQMPMDKVGTREMTTGEKVSVNQKIAATMAAAPQDSSKSMGDGAAELLRLFNEFIEERVDWRTVLRQYIVAGARQRSTYNRSSRRSTARIIFPNLTGDHINVGFGGDSSGSMGMQELGEVQNELRSIMASFESWEIEFITCDTAVHPVGHYLSENGDTYDNVSTEMLGGGGTDMNPMIEYFNEGGDFENTEGERVSIIVTDGYIPPITVDCQHPVILVITSNGNKTFTCDHPDVMVIHIEN